MFILATVVVYLALLYTPGWAEMCDGDGMSDEVRRAFVDKHNEYRSLVAKGKAVNGKIGGFAPKAARMFKVAETPRATESGDDFLIQSYDCAVEKSMMAWAKRCTWGHSPQSARKGLGENIWMISLPDYNKTASAISATASWFNELKRFGVPVNNVLTMDVFNRGVGHYTQVVWQRSDRIGCAVNWCPNSTVKMTFAGCQYREQGNMLNANIYETGSSPCTKNTDCQCNDCKCNATEALCIRPDSTPMPAQKYGK